MPTYQYSCTECGEALEVQQSFSDDPLTVCPACQGRLRKVYNAVGVVFKGSGFYRTDSRAGSGSGEKKGSTSSSPSDAKTSDTKKSDAKSSEAKNSGTKSSSATGSAS